MQIVLYGLACVWLFNLVLMGWGTLYTIWRMNFSRLPRQWEQGTLPVSILKPIKGVDPSLKENLESFALLDYPEYEVILAIADANDPAVTVAQEIVARFPYGPFKLIVGDVTVGANPKVNNLVLPEKMAKYDTLLVSDSNIRAHKSYLRETVPLLRDERYGIVTAPIQGFGGVGLGGQLEQLHMNTFYYRWMCLAKFFGQVFVMGKSMLYSKSTAAKFGGISSCANYINEDYMMGLLMEFVGKKIDLNNRPIHQYVGRRPFREFWQRHYRWSVIQKRVVPWVYAGQPLQFALKNVSIAAIAAPALGILWWKAALLTLLLWFAADAALILSCGELPSFPVWLLREILAPGIWLHALFSNKILWRGNKLVVNEDGRVANVA